VRDRNRQLAQQLQVAFVGHSRLRKTDVAVIACGGIVVGRSIAVAGDKLDEAIVRHIRQAHNPMIGERTAQEIKITIGSVHRLEHEFSPRSSHDRARPSAWRELETL
jgi:hypothetical protein